MRIVTVIFFLFSGVVFSQQDKNNLFGFATSNTFTYCNINDTAFTNKVQAINPQVLRFPGGAVGNFYHFGKNGYGFDFAEIEQYDGGRFVERSKALSRANLKKGHTHDYIEDFIVLAKKTNAKVVLVANMFVNNDDIIKMIEKIQSHQLEVVGIELGSELSNRTFYQKGYTIDDYVEDAKSCSDKIKKNFPKMKTAIVAAPLVTQKNHRHVIWNKRLSEMDFYDAIIVHSYAKVVKGKKEYGQMLTVVEEGQNETEAFNLYKARVLQFFETDFPNEIAGYNKIFEHPIWITEWNLQISRKTGNTLLQSLFVAQYFLELMSNAYLQTITLTTYHNLGGRDYGGSIFRNNKEIMEIQSTYYPLTFVGKIFEHNIIRIEKRVVNELSTYSCYDKNNDIQLRYDIDWKNHQFRVYFNITRYSENELVYYSDNLFDVPDVKGVLNLDLLETIE